MGRIKIQFHRGGERRVVDMMVPSPELYHSSPKVAKVDLGQSPLSVHVTFLVLPLNNTKW